MRKKMTFQRQNRYYHEFVKFQFCSNIIGFKHLLKYIFQIQRCPSKGISKRGQFIPPMSVAKFLNMNKKQQQAMVGDKTFNSLSKAMKVLEQGIYFIL